MIENASKLAEQKGIAVGRIVKAERFILWGYSIAQVYRKINRANPVYGNGSVFLFDYNGCLFSSDLCLIAEVFPVNRKFGYAWVASNKISGWTTYEIPQQ